MKKEIRLQKIQIIHRSAVLFSYLALSLTSFAFGMKATYIVPAPSELTKVSRFEIDNVEWSRQDGKLHVKYPLPVDVVGENRMPIEFTGNITASRFIQVTGLHAHGYCMNAPGGGAPTCLVDYPGLLVDEDKMNTYLETKYMGSELDMRKKLMKLFSADPAGVLNIPSDPAE